MHLDPVAVFPLSITFRQTKPTSLDFLTENVTELKDVLESGLEVDGRVMGVKVRCVVCDAPARALVKDIKNYNAYYGCERCQQKGVWARKVGGKGGRVTFQETENLVPRTDENFRAVEQRPHHLHHEASSPLLELGVDMVLTSR